MPASMSDDEKRLRAYLLKLAPEEELDRIEEAYLSTSEYAGQISDAEDRLVSDFVQGRLSEEEARAFEAKYLVTEERQERVAIARAVGELATMEQVVPKEVGERHASGRDYLNLWRRFLDWVAAPGPAMGLATAVATVVLLLGNVVLFLRSRDQTQQISYLSSRNLASGAQAGKAQQTATNTRVLAIPVLRVEETNLSLGQRQKLNFRLPPDPPDTIEIPLELPPSAEGAVVDVVLSSSGQSVWSERAVKLRDTGRSQSADLRVPFASLERQLGQPLSLEVVERGHAVLATFEIVFAKHE